MDQKAKANLNEISSSHSRSQSQIISHTQQEFSELVTACQSGDFSKVSKLISSRKASASETAPDGVTPLHWAAINNRLNVCRYLLDCGASVDAKGGDLQGTPLHWACRNGLVYIAHLLISRGADPLRTDSQQFNALHLAVHSSNVLLVIYLLHLGIPVDSPDSCDRTPLHWAAYQGDTLTVDSLLKWGADPNATDEKGCTPLHWAIIGRNKATIKRLLEGHADIFAMTNEGKTPRVMAEGTQCLKEWESALKELGRDPLTGAMKPKILSQKTAKLIMFFVPYLLIFFVLQLASRLRYYISIPLALLSVLGSFKLLGRFVLPNIATGPNALMKTPFFAGIFSGTAFWVLVHYSFFVLPTTMSFYPITNFFFIICFSIVTYSFFQSMFRDPGIIPPITNPAEQRAMIEGLIDRGEFDTRHFCISTYVRKPLRAKYDRILDKVVAKYDHYCPWTYNVVGVRNHRIFVVFVLSLVVGIPIYLFLYFKYADIIFQAPADNTSSPVDQAIGALGTALLKVRSAITDNGDENQGGEATPEEPSTPSDGQCAGTNFFDGTLCSAFQVDYYGTLLALWATFNWVWVFFLAFVQIVQVGRGITTNEASNLHRFGFMGADDFSSLPSDHYASTSSGSVAAGSLAAASIRTKSSWNSCLRLLGINQFLATAKDAIPLNSMHSPKSRANPADLGCMTNCSDFWFPRRSYNVLRALPDGAASFGGSPIDYYRMWDFPTTSNKQNDSMTNDFGGLNPSSDGPMEYGDLNSSNNGKDTEQLLGSNHSSNSRDGSAYELVSNQV